MLCTGVGTERCQSYSELLWRGLRETSRFRRRKLECEARNYLFGFIHKYLSILCKKYENIAKRKVYFAIMSVFKSFRTDIPVSSDDDYLNLRAIFDGYFGPIEPLWPMDKETKWTPPFDSDPN